MRRALPGAEWTGAHETSRALRLATAAVVAYSVLSPADRVYGVAASPGRPFGTIAALAGFACFLPVLLWLVVSATRKPFERRQRWALAGMAAVIVAVLPMAGVQWVGLLGTLAGLVLGGLRPPWSFGLYAALAAAPAPLAVAIGHPEWALYFGISMFYVSLPLVTGVWLVRAARDLQAARLELAEQAVVRERLRLDVELGASVGAGLEEVAARATSAATLDDPGAINRELDTLVSVARLTLADARRAVGRYREASLQTELDTAVTLLEAAGIQARLAVSAGQVPGTLDDQGRSMLRRAVADLLSGACGRVTTIAVARGDDGVRISLRPGSDSRTAEVAAR